MKGQSTIVDTNQGCLIAKSARLWLSKGAKLDDPVPLWLNLWYQGEIACLFSDSNMGKSIYAVQIADAISRSQPVLYFDFELSFKQFQMRYSNSKGMMQAFNANFIRTEIDNSMISRAVFEMDLSEQIVEMARRLRVKVIIIDNLTYICNDSESGTAAHEFMVRLTELKKTYGLSVLVLAHTPKRESMTPITQNDLAGSKRLFNFFDSVFAIGKSVKGEDIRYIKQLKARSTSVTYGEDSVLEARIVKDDTMLRFEHGECCHEKVHIKASKSRSRYDGRAMEAVTRMRSEGKTLVQIADELGLSKSAVGRMAQAGVPVLDI